MIATLNVKIKKNQEIEETYCKIELEELYPFWKRSSFLELCCHILHVSFTLVTAAAAKLAPAFHFVKFWNKPTY